MLTLLTLPALAAEGLWPAGELPPDITAPILGHAADADWQDRVRQATLRLGPDCAAVRVSPDGLLLTSQQCVRACLARLSTRSHNRLETGFIARDRADEPICPALAAVQVADGAVYEDVRLAFAPEAHIAHYGGLTDRHRFPRYALDLALLRLYIGDQPARDRAFLRLAPDGAQPGAGALLASYPETWQRHLSVAELRTLRERILPARLVYLAELIGWLERRADSGATDPALPRTLYQLKLRLADLRGQYQALSQPGLMAAAEHAEQALRAEVEKRRALRPLASAWDDIAGAQKIWREIFRDYALLEELAGLAAQGPRLARHLVRAAQQRALPDAQRLPEYREARLPQLTQALFRPAAIDTPLEISLLGWSLGKLREGLGVDHPAVRNALGAADPGDRAEALLSRSGLADIAVRRALWEGGAEAVAASEDPLIILAREIEPLALPLRQRHDRDIEAVLAHAHRQLATARLETGLGPAYPAPDGSLRLSVGRIQAPTHPVSSLAGAFARASGTAPYQLPDSWRSAELALDLSTPMNFVLEADSAGQLAAAPVINHAGAVIGLAFDENLPARGGRYGYLAQEHRVIAAHVAALLTALRDIYNADDLLAELQP